MKATPTVIDLFCGAGGLSEGFSQAGFKVLAGNDFDELAGQTFSATHHGAAFLPGPIEDITAAALLRKAGVRKGELDCLAGGPPCQAFSVYNHQRGMHDDRSGLFREYLRIVEGVQPKWVVMENVTGITSVGNGKAVKEIHTELRRLGYDVQMKVLHAEDYGVPQERRRILFVGNRLGVRFEWPTPTHGAPESQRPSSERRLWADTLSLKPSFVTVWDAIGDLPSISNGVDPGLVPYPIAPQNEYQVYSRCRELLIHNHAAPRLSLQNMERMKYIPQGGSWRDVPYRLLPAGMKRARRCDHTKRYGRLQPDGLACTILTKCDLHWGAFIHPCEDRVLTVREAARLQSFPDRFHFEGPRTEQYVQVGNAVPPLLGRHVAEAVLLCSGTRQKGTPEMAMVS